MVGDEPLEFIPTHTHIMETFRLNAEEIISNSLSEKTKKELSRLDDVLKSSLDLQYPSPTNNEPLLVETKPPLFRITGLDSNGVVQLKTGTEVKLKKGNKSISLQKEHLKDILDKSQQISETINSLDEKEKDERVKKIVEMYANMEKNEGVVINSTNKNAYEIRSDILKYSIEFIKFQYEVNKKLNVEITSDMVLEVANKFYRFVENKKG